MTRIHAALLLALVAAPAAATDDEANSWHRLADQHPAILAFAADYQRFLASSPTELTAVAASVELARAAGFRSWDPLADGDGAALTAGSGLFAVNRGRAIVLARVGRRPLTDGLRVIAAHIDSPRLDLKARPLYDSEGLALLQTIPHGGIKNYQWANVPLALVGHIDRTDGTRVPIDIGRAPDDPVFLITDLAPHVDRPRRDRTSREVVKGEELDPLAGSIPGSDGVLAQIEALLLAQYGVTADDLVSAELQLVPALRPREVGLDRGLIVAYGQDDKLCSYAALRAVIDRTEPEFWTVAYLADNEETGSGNNTGAKSAFLETLVGSWLAAGGGFHELALRRALARSVVASADTTAAVNPMDATVHEKTNASRLNGGVVIKRYGRGTDGNSEVIASVRALLEGEGLPWQTHAYKVGVGGGGTLGGFLSVLGMEVFDVGAPILSMHSPAEVASKADIYALYRFLAAFAAATPPEP